MWVYDEEDEVFALFDAVGFAGEELFDFCFAGVEFDYQVFDEVTVEFGEGVFADFEVLVYEFEAFLGESFEEALAEGEAFVAVFWAEGEDVDVEGDVQAGEVVQHFLVYEDVEEEFDHGDAEVVLLLCFSG